MFWVLNKQKIYTYILSVLMVLFLFCATSTLNVNKENKTIQTSATNSKLLPIYNVQTDENKVSFIMNCEWNADDIDKTLEILRNNNMKITFFMIENWIDKFPEAVKKINSEGHEIVPISELIYKDNYIINSNGTQIKNN